MCICVGNNINCQGTVRIQIKKTNQLLKGENKNANLAMFSNLCNLQK
ncbi:hypothetical protein [Spiroplasma endosymbiont of Amphimallon solstitiale]